MYFRLKELNLQLLLVVGAQMNDRKLAALIGMLRSKCRIVSSPKDVSRSASVQHNKYRLRFNFRGV